jgi:uncharacterized membrane-anchored protein YhcB (DUF1043 family)
MTNRFFLLVGIILGLLLNGCGSDPSVQEQKEIDALIKANKDEAKQVREEYRQFRSHTAS